MILRFFHRKLPPLVKREKIIKILPLLGALTEHQNTYPDINELKILDDLLMLNNISIREAIDKLGTTCENFLLVCQWAGNTFPCFQEHPFMKWESSYSFLGACCSFNYHPEAKSDFVPFASNKFGIDGGVSIIGSGYPEIADGKSGVLYSEGFVVMVHHPFDFAVESAPQTLVRPGYETFITVSPIDSRCSDQVLALPQQRRACIIPADKGIDMYRQPACMLECVRDSVHDECHCHPYNLPRSKDLMPVNYIRECTVVDIYCLVNNFCEFFKIKGHDVFFYNLILFSFKKSHSKK
jgi:acid-sensing ion channel, other